MSETLIKSAPRRRQDNVIHIYEGEEAQCPTPARGNPEREEILSRHVVRILKDLLQSWRQPRPQNS